MGRITDIKAITIDIPADAEKIFDLVQHWSSIYKGEEPWIPGSNKKFRRLRAAKFLCEYLSNLNMSEYTINVDNETAKSVVDMVFDDNNFDVNIRALDEKKEAMGSAIIKVITDGARILLDFVPATNFVPTVIDNGTVTEGIFVSHKKYGTATYTLLEHHKFEDINDARKLVIENTLYRSGDPMSLGSSVPLNAVPEYANLLPRAEFDKQTPLFAYITTGTSNNLTSEPYGISRYANSIDTLEDIDLAANGLRVERSQSKKKIFASKYMLRRNHTGGVDNSELRYDEDTDIYQILDIDTRENQMPDVFDPVFRISEFVQDINTQLNLLCLQTGLSSGSLSFDEKSGIKTATEVISENSKTFSAVAQNQKSLSSGIKLTVENIIFVAQLPEIGLLPASIQPVVSVKFDSGVTPDRNSYIKEGRELYRDKMISLEYFLTEYFGLDAASAKTMMDQIKAETPELPDLFGAQ